MHGDRKEKKERKFKKLDMLGNDTSFWRLTLHVCI